MKMKSWVHPSVLLLFLGCGLEIVDRSAYGGLGELTAEATKARLTDEDIWKAKRICVTPQRRDRIDNCAIAAQANDADAAFFLGSAYTYGSYGVRADQVEAVRWYLIAAKSGSGLSQTILGIRYLCGDGVKQSDAEATGWFARATQEGRHTGYAWMGYMSELGRGTSQDFAKALKWYMGALPYNSEEALFRVGVLYARGRGVSMDQVKAQQYFQAAQKKILLLSSVLGGGVYLGMGEVAASGKRLPPEEEQEQLRQMRSRAANGDANAAFNLGLAYFASFGVKEDKQQAFKYFQSAASSGHSAARFNVAQMYLRGWGVEKDYSEAANWFQRASEGGDARAAVGLGWLLLTGTGVQINRERGLGLIQQAAQEGEREAQTMLALLYAQGKFVGQDLNAADEWWSRRMSCEQLTRHQQ